MKTETTMQAYETPLQAIETFPSMPNEKSRLRVIHKSDLHNHRFAVNDNQSVQNAANWDHGWFASYE